MRTSIEIYALSVCFTTLMCFMVALGIGLYDAVQYMAPQFTANHGQTYATNDMYLQYYPDKSSLPAEEITRLRLAAQQEILDGEQRAALQSGLFVVIVMLIDAVVFGLHWRVAKSSV